jgi:hypothetical protein
MNLNLIVVPSCRNFSDSIPEKSSSKQNSNITLPPLIHQHLQNCESSLKNLYFQWAHHWETCFQNLEGDFGEISSVREAFDRRGNRDRRDKFEF